MALISRPRSTAEILALILGKNLMAEQKPLVGATSASRNRNRHTPKSQLASTQKRQAGEL